MTFKDENEETFYNRSLEFLKFFSRSPQNGAIYLSSGDNSIICNPNTEWTEFLGYSIGQIAGYVAEKQGINIEYLD